MLGSSAHPDLILMPTVQISQNNPATRRGRHESPAWLTVSARRNLGRLRRQFRDLLRARTQGGVVPVRLPRQRARIGPHHASGADRPHLARLHSRAFFRDSCMATGFTARTTPSADTGSTPTRSCSNPTPRPLAGTFAGATKSTATAFRDPKEDLAFDTRDNAPFAMLAAVIDPAFTWGEDRRPARPGTRRSSTNCTSRASLGDIHGCQKRCAGTYAGLGSDEAIRHLQDLGVTAVELMPVHHHAYDRHLVERHLSNYWGYNTSAFFAPDIRYAMSRSSSGSVREFKTMVRNLHAAGIEVILDVVYNHTAEGDHLGPTLSLRGVDNVAYYRLDPKNPRFYQDYTGCGNTLNMRHPRVLQLIMDSLRYWILEMHVDGFRFDLASALARELHAVDRLGAFFDIIHQDPVISQVKLIAEPWDLGEGGYQVGNFPVGWAEWNGRYRDSIRQILAIRPRPDLRVRHAHRRAAAISTITAAVVLTPASTSSPAMMGSRFTISSATTRSTTKRTSKAIATARTTTIASTTVLKDPRPMRRSALYASGRSATSWRRSSSRSACRCCMPATRWGARSAATTTPIARTTRSAGSTGSDRPSRKICSASRST